MAHLDRSQRLLRAPDESRSYPSREAMEYAEATERMGFDLAEAYSLASGGYLDHARIKEILEGAGEIAREESARLTHLAAADLPLPADIKGLQVGRSNESAGVGLA